MLGNLTTTLNLGAFSEEEKVQLKGDSPIKRKMNDIVKKPCGSKKRYLLLLRKTSG